MLREGVRILRAGWAWACCVQACSMLMGRAAPRRRACRVCCAACSAPGSGAALMMRAFSRHQLLKVL
eukprot:2206425-Pleurochrysis_carterae.AAC.1